MKERYIAYTLMLPPSLMARIEALALAEDRSRSSLTRRLLEESLSSKGVFGPDAGSPRISEAVQIGAWCTETETGSAG